MTDTTDHVRGDALPESLRETLGPVGYGDEVQHAATAVIVDHHIEHIDSEDDRVEILPLAEALRRYEWVQDLMFGLIDSDHHPILAEAAESVLEPLGTFIRVKEGAKVSLPVQTFTTMITPQARQHVHDITVIGAGAEVDMISGVNLGETVHSGHHVSLSETYIGAGARVRSVSIERWGSKVDVHSFTRTDIADGATWHSTSLGISGLRTHLQDDHTTVGSDAVCVESSITRAPKGTNRTIRTVVDLAGRGARAETVARMVSDGGIIDHFATVIGREPGTSGHLACDGLKTSADGVLGSTPELMALTDQAQLSHEASVGMVGADKLAYLMALGLDEDQSRDLIVQGFLALDEELLPEAVRPVVRRIVHDTRESGM